MNFILRVTLGVVSEVLVTGNQAIREMTMKVVGILGNYFRPERCGAPSPFGAYYLNKDYVDSFSGMDVLPIQIPYLANRDRMLHFINLFDGLLLTGGFDIPPNFYNQSEIEAVEFTYDFERTIFELEFLPLVEKSGKPIFAICLGLQMFNVHRGGNLIQDVYQQLGTPINHNASSKDSKILAHDVKITKGSRLREIVGSDELLVNSSHHQAIDRLGSDLISTALSDDGVIEAVECTRTPFFGVQWHPESLQYDCRKQARLFEAFVEML